MRNTIASIFVFLIFSFAGSAATLTLSSDSSSYLIGEQAKVTLLYSGTTGFSALPFSIADDTLNSNVEVLEVQTVDTLIATNTQLVKQTFIVTAWDTGHFVIYPRQGILNDSILESNPILLIFKDLAIDPSGELKPIKEQLDAPWSISEIKGLLLIIGCVIVGLTIMILAIYFYNKHKKKQGVDVVIPVQSKTEILWERFNQLQKSEIWKNGHEKEFHSELSSILRGYLDIQYKITATEATSSEIISSLKNYNINSTELKDIELILNFSDRIKFAKGSGSVNQHENALDTLQQFLEKIPTDE